MVEEKNIGRNGGIGRKDTVRHTNDCMQVEFGKQLPFDCDLGRFGIEKETIG